MTKTQTMFRILVVAAAGSLLLATPGAYAKHAKAKRVAEVKAVQADESALEEAGETIGAKLVVDPGASAPAAGGALAGETLPQAAGDSAAPTAAVSVQNLSAPAAIAQAAAALPAAQAPAADKNKLPENEIPVLTNAKDQKKSEGGAYGKLVATLAVLVVLFGGLSYGLKKWMAKNGGKNQNTRLKVLTQHHLGPKKSLAIVSVAGESLLIGITDHHISMLKTLSLLDEEIPEATPARFDQAMGDFDEDADEAGSDSYAIQGLSEIRDKVSVRLKGMRRL